jgi:RimJ/RimL family protein N-acetyltransferase
MLETVRLRLRPLVSGDAALFTHLYTDGDVMRRILPPLSVDAAARVFERACRHTANSQPGHRYWTIEEKSTDAAIGIAALLRAGESAELGVMLRREAWQRGISSEAFVPLIDHAFLRMGLELITAQRPEDDHALIIDRLLGRFGFARVPERAGPGQARWELPRTRWAGPRIA